MDLAPTANVLLIQALRWARYTVLANAIVVHAFVIAGVLGFGLAAGLERAPDATVAVLVALDEVGLLALLDPGERSFRQHALYLFGLLSLVAFVVGSLLSLLRRALRGEAGPPPRPSLPRTLRRLALADLLLAVLLFAVVMLIPRSDPFTLPWGLRAAATALAFGLIAFLVSAPLLTIGHVVGLLGDALARSGWPASRGAGPARSTETAAGSDEVQ